MTLEKERAEKLVTAIQNGIKDEVPAADLLQFLLCELEFVGAQYRKRERERNLKICDDYRISISLILALKQSELDGNAELRRKLEVKYEASCELSKLIAKG